MKVFALLVSLATATATLDVVRPDAPLAVPAKIVGAPADGDIHIERTVKSIDKAKGTLTIDHGCSGSDQYGNSVCDLNWGDAYNLTYDVVTEEDLNSKTNLDVHLTLDGIIPFHISCAICGANCTFTIPIVKKTITIPFGQIPCPIAAGTVQGSLPFTLPAKDPVPLKISFAGEGKLTDDAGALIADLTVKGAVHG